MPVHDGGISSLGLCVQAFRHQDAGLQGVAVHGFEVQVNSVEAVQFAVTGWHAGEGRGRGGWVSKNGYW